MSNNDEDRQVFVIVSKKLMLAWFITYATALLFIGLATLWANYIDKRSNQRWCGIVVMFDDTYKETPPTTPLGQNLATEFKILRQDFKCK